VCCVAIDVPFCSQAAAKCPRVVQLLGTTMHERCMCIVMKLYRGNLLAVIAAAPGGKLAVPQALEVCVELFGALAELHAAGIVHRVSWVVMVLCFFSVLQFDGGLCRT
jgi:hypothetical protein